MDPLPVESFDVFGIRIGEFITQRHVFAAHQVAGVDRLAAQHEALSDLGGTTVVPGHPEQTETLQQRGDQDHRTRTGRDHREGDFEPGEVQGRFGGGRGAVLLGAPDPGEDEQDHADGREEARGAEHAEVLGDIDVAGRQPGEEDQGAIDVRAEPSFAEARAHQPDRHGEREHVGAGFDDRSGRVGLESQIAGESKRERPEGDGGGPGAGGVLVPLARPERPACGEEREGQQERIPEQSDVIGGVPTAERPDDERDDRDAERPDEAEASSIGAACRVKGGQGQRQDEAGGGGAAAETEPVRHQSPGDRTRNDRLPIAVRRDRGGEQEEQEGES